MIYLPDIWYFRFCYYRKTIYIYIHIWISSQNVFADAEAANASASILKRLLEVAFLVSILAQVFSDFRGDQVLQQPAFPHNFLPVQYTQLSKLSLTVFLWLGTLGCLIIWQNSCYTPRRIGVFLQIWSENRGGTKSPTSRQSAIVHILQLSNSATWPFKGIDLRSNLPCLWGANRHGPLCHIEAVTRSYGTRDSTGLGDFFLKRTSYRF